MTVEKTSVVDWTPLLMLRGLQPPDQPDIVRDLIDSFLADSVTRMAHLHEGANAGDLKIVAHEAHTIKGSAALLGAEPLRAVAEALETAARRGAVLQQAGSALAGSGQAGPTLAEMVRQLDEAVELARTTLAKGPPAA